MTGSQQSVLCAAYDEEANFFIGLSYIYERPMLMGRLNLKMFKFGKCAHFHLICIKCAHFPENARKCTHFHLICIKCAHFPENACIFLKMQENARISI